jgi:tyrosine-protein phosphatase SIW14
MVKDYKLAGKDWLFRPVNRNSKVVFAWIFISSLVLSLTSGSLARTDGKKEHDERQTSSAASTGSSSEVTVGVENFGKVTDFFFRGAQPKGEEYNRLAALGIKTVIDLRNDPKAYAKSLAEGAGMKYINFPLSDKSYPASDVPTKFLELINNQQNWPVYVHCAGGRHRTGAMAAVFRMTMQGWDINRAYEEMKEYDFYTRWGHGAMKEFVFKYYKELLGAQLQPKDQYSNR